MKDEIRDGEEARQLMENRIFRQAVEKVEENIVNAMKRAAVNDEVLCNRLVISLQLLNQIVKGIETVIQTGKMAEIDAQRGVKARLKAFAGLGR
jgi:hypothetical protein